MNIGRIKNGNCSECGNKGPGLRDIELGYREPKVRFVLCPACCVMMEKVLKVERERPHLREP